MQKIILKQKQNKRGEATNQFELVDLNLGGKLEDLARRIEEVLGQVQANYNLKICPLPEMLQYIQVTKV
jgi:hypothetical protein